MDPFWPFFSFLNITFSLVLPLLPNLSVVSFSFCFLFFAFGVWEIDHGRH